MCSCAVEFVLCLYLENAVLFMPDADWHPLSTQNGKSSPATIQPIYFTPDLQRPLLGIPLSGIERIDPSFEARFVKECWCLKMQIGTEWDFKKCLDIYSHCESQPRGIFKTVVKSKVFRNLPSIAFSGSQAPKYHHESHPRCSSASLHTYIS